MELAPEDPNNPILTLTIQVGPEKITKEVFFSCAPDLLRPNALALVLNSTLKVALEEICPQAIELLLANYHPTSLIDAVSKGLRIPENEFIPTEEGNH